MRKLILAAVMASAALPLTAAPAQSRYDNEYSREQRECARELREADNAREYRR